MKKLTFKLDPERLTLNQLIAMQDGDIRTMRDVLANTLVDESGEHIEFEKAKTIIGDMNLAQIKETSEEFARQVKEQAINPTSGGD